MKKIILFLIIFTSLSFSKVDLEKYDWIGTEELSLLKDKLEYGDLLIFKPLDTFIQSFGHIAMIGDDKKIVDFPNMKNGLREIPIELLKQPREVIVIRYKYMTESFKENLKKEIDKYNNTMYSFFSPPNYSYFGVYCSSFIYNIFENSNEGETTIFPFNQNAIFPLDFLQSGYNFEILEF